MLSEQNIPYTWKEVLCTVQRAFPGACIAGGALRDLDHLKPVKDVDIFIPLTQRLSDKKIRSLLDFPYSTFNVHLMNINKTKTCDRTIWSIYHLHMYGIEFELIFAVPNACDIKTFDINICQIEFDGINVRTTTEYCHGVQNKEIHFVNPQSQKRQDERIARIKEKYTEYKIIIPNKPDTPETTFGILSSLIGIVKKKPKSNGY